MSDSDPVAAMRRHEDDHEVPWAMPLVVLRDKHELASEVDVCEVAASAVVAFLDDERSRAGGPWHDAVEYWREGAIRKVVRRADGKRWDDVQALPGVTVERHAPDGAGPAAVRVFVPAPVAPLPKALGKLQVGGTDFPSERGSSAQGAVVTIAVSPHVSITSGKAAAQCAHAAQLAYERLAADGADARVLESWRDLGFAVRVVFPTGPEWEALDAPVQVFDAGFTELDGVTETARASW